MTQQIDKQQLAEAAAEIIRQKYPETLKNISRGTSMPVQDKFQIIHQGK